MKHVDFVHPHLSRESMPEQSAGLLAEVMDHIPLGVIMFNADGCLAVCNRRYIEMYGLSMDVVKPGCTLHELISHRRDTGQFSGSVSQYCADILRTIERGHTARQYITTTDGRSINVVNQPIPSGGWIATHEDVTSYRSAVAQIEYLSHYDELTGLPNRGLFNVHLSEALLLTEPGRPLAVHFINLLDFRALNDRLGYPVGDAVLKAFVERLSDCVGEHGFIARLEGDQFGLIQMDARPPLDAVKMAKSILKAAAAPYDMSGQNVTVEATIGIALSSDDGFDADKLLRNAGFALSAANAAGPGEHNIYRPFIEEQLLTRQRLLEQRKIALGRG